MAKTALIFAGGAAVVWTAACLALWRWQEKMIFFPNPVPSDAVLQYADLAIDIPAGDGVILRGWQHPGSDNAPNTDCELLIYFGGNNEEVSSHLGSNGGRYACRQWYVNYRGYGQSDGKPSAELLRKDALAIFDEAVSRLNIAPEKICVIGRSLGSHMAAHVAANRAVRKLILVTPFDSALNIARGRYPIFPVKLLMRHPFNTLEDAPSVTADTLFIIAQHDFVVPHARSRNLVANWRAPHEVVQLPETSHNNMEVPEYWRAIAKFLSPSS